MCHKQLKKLSKEHEINHVVKKNTPSTTHLKSIYYYFWINEWLPAKGIIYLLYINNIFVVY